MDQKKSSDSVFGTEIGTAQGWTYRIDANASSEERFFKVLMVMTEIDASIGRYLFFFSCPVGKVLCYGEFVYCNDRPFPRIDGYRQYSVENVTRKTNNATTRCEFPIGDKIHHEIGLEK